MYDYASTASQAFTKDETLELGPRLLDQVFGNTERSSILTSLQNDLPKYLAEQNIFLEESVELFLSAGERLLQADINSSIDAVLHHDKVNELLARWASLERLVKVPEAPEDSEIYLKVATKNDILTDLSSVGDAVQDTTLYKQLVRQNFGAFGGRPFLMAIYDFRMGPGEADVKLMDCLAQLNELGHMPGVGNASPRLLGADTFAEIPDTRAKILQVMQRKELNGYKTYREKTYSRYLSLCMPRYSVRAPFHSTDNPATDLEGYSETVTMLSDLTMSDAAFAMGENVIRAMGLIGWPGAIIGEYYGGKVEGVITYTFTTATGEKTVNIPTELVIDDELEKPFSDLGLIPLIHKQGTGIAAFFSAATTQRALLGRDPKQAASAELATQLPNVFIVSRFAHFLKPMLRALVGANLSPADVQSKLQDWANDYVLENPEGCTDEVKALHPFQKIKVTVNDCPDKPGHLNAVVELVPHYRVASFKVTLVITPG